MAIYKSVQDILDKVNEGIQATLRPFTFEGKNTKETRDLIRSKAFDTIASIMRQRGVTRPTPMVCTQQSTEPGQFYLEFFVPGAERPMHLDELYKYIGLLPPDYEPGIVVEMKDPEDPLAGMLVCKEHDTYYAPPEEGVTIGECPWCMKEQRDRLLEGYENRRAERDRLAARVAELEAIPTLGEGPPKGPDCPKGDEGVEGPEGPTENNRPRNKDGVLLVDLEDLVPDGLEPGD